MKKNDFLKRSVPDLGKNTIGTLAFSLSNGKSQDKLDRKFGIDPKIRAYYHPRYGPGPLRKIPKNLIISFETVIFKRA